MKKLTKLGISPEKIMKNEELINLQGGYDVTCTCEQFDSSTGEWFIIGSGICGGFTSCAECGYALTNWYGWTPTNCW